MLSCASCRTLSSKRSPLFCQIHATTPIGLQCGEYYEQALPHYSPPAKLYASTHGTTASMAWYGGAVRIYVWEHVRTWKLSNLRSGRSSSGVFICFQVP